MSFNSLSKEMLSDISVIMRESGNPTWTWAVDGNVYPCVASISKFKRDLVEGGFVLDELLTLTVPRYDFFDNPIFPSDIIPAPQQRLTFNGVHYRIESVKVDAIYDYNENGNKLTNGTRIRIIAVCPFRGI